MTTTAIKHLADLREMIEDQMFDENCTNEQLCFLEDMFIMCQSAIDAIEDKVTA